MRVGGFGIVHETIEPPSTLWPSADGLDAMAARRERLSAANALSWSAPSPSTNANAVIASASRCGYTVPSGSVRCVKSVTGAMERLSRCAAGHAAPVDDPAILHADLAGLGERRA